MNDVEPTEEERAEAEALARALERGTGSARLPEDALEAAALLRFSRGEGNLPEERRRAVLEEVLGGRTVGARTAAQAGAAGSPERPRSPRSPWRVWALALPAGGLAAAAAALLIVSVAQDAPPGRADAVALPAPDAALLAAHAGAAGGDAAASRELERRMGEYRAQLFASLQQNHGGQTAP